MTAQINDVFRLHGIKYSLAGISEGTLFDPALFNMNPSSASTACWRGYLAVFAIYDTHLVVDELHVNLYEEGAGYQRKQGPIINGVSPTLSNKGIDFFNNHYEGLKYNLAYSGGLLLADDFISELYVHMGFHPAWKYRKVVELIFENGILRKQIDRSAKMAEIRRMAEDLEKNTGHVKKPNDQQIRLFIERSFDRTYKL